MAKQPSSGNGVHRTEYIVLQQIDIGDQTPENPAGVAWAPVLNAAAKDGPDLKPKVFLAPSKTAAIRLHTGDGADVIVGTWKAVPLSSWKGGEVTKRVTAAEREAVLD